MTTKLHCSFLPSSSDCMQVTVQPAPATSLWLWPQNTPTPSKRNLRLSCLHLRALWPHGARCAATICSCFNRRYPFSLRCYNALLCHACVCVHSHSQHLHMQPAPSLSIDNTSDGIPSAFTSRRVYSFDRAGKFMQLLRKRAPATAASASISATSLPAAGNNRPSGACSNSHRNGIV